MLKTDFEKFTSPTLGRVSFEELIEKTKHFISEDDKSSYKVVVGTDSSSKEKIDGDFVSVILVHRIGSGGIYFWNRSANGRFHHFKERIYQEALFSLEIAEKLTKELKGNGLSLDNLEIHVDIGPKGETREMISEIVGMIKGNGFNAKIKPESYGASCVADRHT
ncbi:MAG: hypothetical protein A2Y57_00465 [Candidatus Woykebacteria bacterium RBG_13_40_7b]|uniref:DUF458 domain-containing protein n=1 Tax=Candidatus Woykebacteria bacterium RBG_13_40_7b TaxID=1802594 RepID=A0A1G1WAK2_9BACT|nr:MAG: hypothetical protein A2Y57_00465 [Candidatus Woykebacteria bacterium RBG_13_40_7b]